MKGNLEVTRVGVDSLRGVYFWNLVALFITGLAGILANTLIFRFCGNSVLGLFNQAVAFYIVSSQILALGQQLSVLRHCSISEEEPLGSILLSALFIGVFMGLVGAGVMGFTNIFGFLLPQWPRGQVWILAPACAFSALNKSLLMFIISRNRPHFFAFLQGLKPAVFILGVTIIVNQGWRDYRLLYSILVSEAVVLILALGYVLFLVRFPPEFRIFIEWLPKHLGYGLKSYLIGVLIELNSKIDILILGALVPSAVVGSYSIIAFAAEGYYLLFATVRTVVNPQIARLSKFGDRLAFNHFSDTIKKGVVRGILLALPLMAFASFVYLRFIVRLADWHALFLDLMIIVLCISFVGTRIVFDWALTQTGRPGIQSIILVGATTIIAVGIIVLVPFHGITGAAVAMGVGYMWTPLVTSWVFKKVVSRGFGKADMIGD